MNIFGTLATVPVSHLRDL